MAFGGYKFAGFKVNNAQYATSIERCLAIHAARVRAFLKASGLAENPWVADNSWKNGSIDLDVTTGALTNGVNNGIIHALTSYNGDVHGYSSYFKYNANGVDGYYCILTTDSYRFGGDPASYPNSIILNTQALNIEKASTPTYAPHNASCLHCLSTVPFGDSIYNLITMQTPSTRLKSIGFNYQTNSSPSSVTTDGFVGRSVGTTLYGYAIKGTDLIIFSGTDFTSTDTSMVVVLSLNGFSELYNKNDIYGFLEYDIKNDSSAGYYEEYNSHGYKGMYDQVFSTTGGALIGNSNSHNFIIRTILDPRTSYNASGAQTTPFSGILIGIYDTYSTSSLPFSDSTQVVKGCTNPELLAVNQSTGSPSLSSYDSAFDGKLLYLYRSSNSTAVYGFRYGRDANSNNTWSVRSNFYVGWDPSNPDIKTDAAWPDYNATLSA